MYHQPQTTNDPEAVNPAPGISPSAPGVGGETVPLSILAFPQETPSAAPSPPKLARLTVVHTVYHTSPGEGPVLLSDSRFSRWLETDEQPWVRRFRVGPEWMRLETGWLEAGAGHLTLTNEEGQGRTTVPTEEERIISAQRVVELAIEVDQEGPAGKAAGRRTMWTPKAAGPAVPMVAPFALVRPGESCRFEPTAVARLWVRCLGDNARVALALCPL